MMQLVCNGVRLDLPDDGKLQFKQDNPLWAFDNMACERTTEFKLPATPTNDAVFQLARIPAYYGEYMRRKIDAQLYVGTIIKSGYVYVSEYDGKEYKAIFVTGVYLGLQRIKDAGVIADVLPADLKNNTLCTISAVGVPPYVNRSELFGQLSYITDGEYPLPSVRLHTIIESALQQLNVQVSLPEITQYIRYIPAGIGLFAATGTHLVNYAYGLREDSWPLVYEPSLDNVTDKMFTYGADSKIKRQEGRIGNYTYFNGVVRHMVAKQQVMITFPDDWDDDLFIGHFINGETFYVAEFQFYGDRSFDAYGGVSGESLRGRSVVIPQGWAFTIVDKASYINQDYSGGHIQGWDLVGVDCHFTVEGDEISVGGTVRLGDNLPEKEVTELLKTIAALSGKILTYTDEDGISFDDLDINSWDVFNLDGIVTARKNVKRTFSDYKQNNVVRFESGDNVPQSDRLSVVYTIDNDNLDNEKELQSIPFSEGAIGGLYLDRQILKTFDGEETLADASSPMGTISSMARVLLLKNSGLQTLCDASTQFKVKAHMLLLEYESITPKTLLQLDGKRYVWTALEWQDDEASITLARLP